MAPPRRSARARNLTEESAIDSSPPETSGDVDAPAGIKRKRSSDQNEQNVNDARTPEPPAIEANTSVNGHSPPKTKTGRPRGRPPKVRPVEGGGQPSTSAPSSSGAAAAAVSPAPAKAVNGEGSPGETRSSTRNAPTAPTGVSTADNAAGAADEVKPVAQPTGQSSASSEILHPRAAALASGAMDEAEELYLSSDDAEKLLVVAQSFAPDVLTALLPSNSHFATVQSGSKGKLKAPHPVSAPSTLKEALDGRQVPLRQLRCYLLILSESPNESEQKATADTRRLSNCALLLRLVDQIARDHRRTENRVLKVEEPTSLSAMLSGETSKGEASQNQKYAMHMRLPTGDYFTRAATMTPAEAEKMPVGLADLVAVEPKPHDPASSQAPTIGERMPMEKSLIGSKTTVEELREHRLGKVVPVSHLYYGPYSSFGPTYDSTASSMSAAATRLMWRDHTHPQVRAAKRRWTSSKADRPIEPPPSAPVPQDEALSKSSLPRSIDIKSLQEIDPSIDVGFLEAAYQDVDRQSALQATLMRCATLLIKLQEHQLRRLQRGYADSLSQLKSSAASSSSTSRLHPLAGDDPDEEELDVAAQVVETLTALLRLRPRSSTSETESPLLPLAADLRALSRSAAVDPAFSSPSLAAADVKAGYWGNLDHSLYGPDAPQRLIGQVSTIVPMFESNDTARLDAAGEHRAMNRALRQRGVPIGVGKDHGSGLMERSAHRSAEAKRAATSATSGTGSANGTNAARPPVTQQQHHPRTPGSPAARMSSHHQQQHPRLPPSASPGLMPQRGPGVGSPAPRLSPMATGQSQGQPQAQAHPGQSPHVTRSYAHPPGQQAYLGMPRFPPQQQQQGGGPGAVAAQR